jgi:hypothetical protein
MRTLACKGFIAGILLLVCSCHNENLELKGRVVDATTKAGIPARDIIVQVLIPNEKNFIPVYKGEFSTDSTGNFEYFLMKDKSEFLFNFSFIGDSAYSYKNVRMGLAELNRDGKFLTFDLDRLADLTISLESKSDNSMNESVFLSWKSDEKEGQFLYPYKVMNHGSPASNQVLRWTGGDVNSEIKTKVFADKETIVKCEIYRYGKVRQVRDTIMCLRDVANHVSFAF